MGVEEVRAYRSSVGHVFDSKRDAYIDELKVLVAFIVDEYPSSIDCKRLVDVIEDKGDVIIEAVHAIRGKESLQGRIGLNDEDFKDLVESEVDDIQARFKKQLNAKSRREDAGEIPGL